MRIVVGRAGSGYDIGVSAHSELNDHGCLYKAGSQRTKQISNQRGQIIASNAKCYGRVAQMMGVKLNGVRNFASQLGSFRK